MTFEPFQKALAALRDLAPYFVIEPLLPGGTLVALLLWLSQAFVRDRLSQVRQYLHAPRSTGVLAASGVSRATKRRLCARTCDVVAAWRSRLVQWCEVAGSLHRCCAVQLVHS
jgi:hypothetical protein